MLKNIQTLRFLAALLVLLHHMQPPISAFSLNMLPEVFNSFGFAGVDLFFVISGLIMAETTRNMAPGWKTSVQFLIQRFGRIYIGYWPFFFLYFFGALAIGSIDPKKSIFGSFFLIPQDLQSYFLPIAWTLSFELYFYIVIALIIAWSRRQAAFVLASCGLVVVVINLWCYHKGIYLPINEARAKSTLFIPFYVSPLVLEFVAGFLISEWLYRKPRINLGCWLAGAAVLFAAAYAYQTSGNLFASGMAGFFHVSERVLLIGGFSCCIVVCAMELERRGITPWTIAQELGNASYGVYLAHMFFIILMGRLYNKLPQILQLPNVWGLITVILVLACSWLFYKNFERPLNIFLKRFLIRNGS
jgi:exopolysaccharide production protein ExoZ